jgi:hypothetical protein
VDHHTRRLVDYDDAVVLIQNAEGDILGRSFEWRKLGRIHLDNLCSPEYVGWPGGLAVYLYTAIPNPALQT